LIVCDDADLDKAVEATVLSACSNAGQRCAAGTRIIVFDAVYETFKEKLLERVRSLKVGCQDTDDFGPVINEEQLENMVAAVEKARAAGALLLTGGKRMVGPATSRGYFMEPTVLEDSDPLIGNLANGIVWADLLSLQGEKFRRGGFLGKRVPLWAHGGHSHQEHRSCHDVSGENSSRGGCCERGDLRQ
jgi:hypothetical protein